MIGIIGIDPDGVIVDMRAALHDRTLFDGCPSVRGVSQRRAAHPDDIGIVRIDPDLAVIGRPVVEGVLVLPGFSIIRTLEDAS